jgi:hypothetical protein
MTVPPKPRRKLLNMRLPVDLIDRIDAHRGKENRTAFFERVAEAELAGDTPPPQNGTPAAVPSAPPAKRDTSGLTLAERENIFVIQRAHELRPKVGPTEAKKQAQREWKEKHG